MQPYRSHRHEGNCSGSRLSVVCDRQWSSQVWWYTKYTVRFPQQKDHISVPVAGVKSPPVISLTYHHHCFCCFRNSSLLTVLALLQAGSSSRLNLRLSAVRSLDCCLILRLKEYDIFHHSDDYRKPQIQAAISAIQGWCSEKQRLVFLASYQNQQPIGTKLPWASQNFAETAKYIWRTEVLWM